jgi:hypothetical protein
MNRSQQAFKSLALLLLIGLVAQADERGFPLPPFKLAPLKLTDEQTPLRKRQIERFNLALEMLGEAYGKFDQREGSLADVVEAAERVIAASKDGYETPADRDKFYRQHLDVAGNVRNCVEERRKVGTATDQDVRLAKYWLLTIDAETVRAVSGPPGLPSDPRIPVVSVPELDRVEPAELEQATARLIDAHCYANQFEFFADDEARLAIAVDKTLPMMPRAPLTPPRLALWDLAQCKLLRFLSASPDKGTAEYAGDDDADFGAAVGFRREIRRFVFSPDGRLVVGLQPRDFESDDLLVWETATGTLARTITVGPHHNDPLLFIDERHFISKSQPKRGAIVEMVDVETGEVSDLIKPGSGEVYGGLLHERDIVFTRGGLTLFDLDTKVETKFHPPPPGTSAKGGKPLWLNKKGEVVVQAGETIETWDMKKLSFVRDCRIVPDNRPQDVLRGAADANLIARRRPLERKIDFIDLDKDEVVTTIPLPFNRMELCALSRDAKRLALVTDDKPVSILVLEFPGGLPRGLLAIDGLLKKAGRKALR